MWCSSNFPSYCMCIFAMRAQSLPFSYCYYYYYYYDYYLYYLLLLLYHGAWRRGNKLFSCHFEQRRKSRHSQRFFSVYTYISAVTHECKKRIKKNIIAISSTCGCSLMSWIWLKVFYSPCKPLLLNVSCDCMRQKIKINDLYASFVFVVPCNYGQLYLSCTFIFIIFMQRQ